MKNNSPVLLIDALGIDIPGGARTAVLCLFDQLVRLKPGWCFHIFLSRREDVFDGQINVHQHILPIRKGILARLITQIILPFINLRINADLVHFTKSQGSVMTVSKKVITIFDATILVHPEMYPFYVVWYWRYIFPRVLQHYDAVITISNDASMDIQRFMNVPPEKIHVIHCASQFEQTINMNKWTPMAPVENPLIPDHYMLFVGGLSNKKNLSTVIKAISILRQDHKEVPALIIVGPYYYKKDGLVIIDLIKDLNLSDKILYLGQVPPEELHKIYQNADLLVFPSIHEGFGIPLLEAMSFGVPIIASRSSAIPEVVDCAGLLIDDFLSPQAWAENIQLLLSNDKLRESLVKNGHRQVSQFTWKASAQKVAHIYEVLLDLT